MEDFMFIITGITKNSKFKGGTKLLIFVYLMTLMHIMAS